MVNSAPLEDCEYSDCNNNSDSESISNCSWVQSKMSRRSARQQERKQKETEAATSGPVTRRRSNNSSNNNNKPSTASTKQPPPPVAKTKSPIVNPYASRKKRQTPNATKKKPPTKAKKRPRVPLPQQKDLPPPPALAPAPAPATPGPRPFTLPTPPTSPEETATVDGDDTVATIESLPTDGVPVNLNFTLDLPEVEASVPLLLPNTSDDTIDFDELLELNTTEFSLHGILQSIKENPINFNAGTMNSIDVSSLTFNTTAYERRKAGIVRDFYSALANHPQGAPLAEYVQDPDDPSNKAYRLEIICRAPPAQQKHQVLNWALLVYSLVMVKVQYRGEELHNDPILYSQAQYEPDTVAVRFRMLFAYFKSKHITYRLYKDFNGPGEVQAYWLEVFRITKENRHDFGTLPNKSDFDENWFEKRAAAANDDDNEYKPFKNIEHYVWTALQNIAYTFCTRGALEPTSICIEDFVQDYIDEGEFKGLPYIRLKEDYMGQKGQKLSIKKPVIDAENTKKKTCPCPYNTHPLSCYQTTITLMKWCPPRELCKGLAPGAGRRIFRKPASKLQLEQWEKQGKPWRLSTSQVLGPNIVNKKLLKIAEWCGFDNAKRCTAHGTRRAGISKYANSGCGPALLKQAGGHSSLQMVATYHKPNQDAMDRAIRCKAGSPTAIRKQLQQSNSDPFAPLPLPDNDQKEDEFEDTESLTDEDYNTLMEDLENSKLPPLLDPPIFKDPPTDNRKDPPTYRAKDPPPTYHPNPAPFSDRTNVKKERSRRVSDVYSPRASTKHHASSPARGRRHRSYSPPSPRRHSSGHRYSSGWDRHSRGHHRESRGRHSPREKPYYSPSTSPEIYYRPRESRRSSSWHRQYCSSPSPSPEHHRPERKYSPEEQRTPYHRRHASSRDPTPRAKGGRQRRSSKKHRRVSYSPEEPSGRTSSNKQVLYHDQRLSRSYDDRYALPPAPPPVQEARPSYQVPVQPQAPQISHSFDAIHQQQSFSIRRQHDPPQQLVTYTQQPVRHYQQVPPYMPDSYGVVRNPSGRVVYGTL